MKKTIFISIAAYNEPDLVQTIKSALDMASHPDRLRFGVSCHYNDNNSPDLSMFNNLKKINIDYKAQLGCPPSRLNTFYLYDDEALPRKYRKFFSTPMFYPSTPVMEC